jgi:hypothetical protein
VASDSHNDKTPGKPRDALDELLRTVARSAGAPAQDPDVALAFVAGWHAGEAIVAAQDADAARVELACAQIRADAARLKKRLEAVDQDAAALGDAIRGLAGAQEDRPGAAEALSATLGAQLLAADFRLGKGFSVGRAMAALCARTRFSAAAFREDLLDGHDKLHDWLSQLATALPPNAAHSVRDSLNMWGQALADGAHVDDLAHDDVIRQGERWRSLLSGEKAGKDALELTDYVGVAEGMVAQIRRLAVRAVLAMKLYLLAVVALAVLGVVGIVVWQHTAGSAAGIASILTALGLTWKGLGGSLGRAVARVEQPAWDAEVDRAIAYAISTPLPDALIQRAPDGTLLAGLAAWRKSHARPHDQGSRRSPPRGYPSATASGSDGAAARPARRVGTPTPASAPASASAAETPIAGAKPSANAPAEE